MPKGSFVIILPLDKDYKVLGYYFKDGHSIFEVTSDIFLRLNLDHSKDDYNLLSLKGIRLFSYLHTLKGKIARKASKVIIGLLLNESDEPEKFRASLKETAEAVEVLGLEVLDMSQDKFEQLLKDIYLEHLEPLTDILKPEALRESIINITKFMLSGGKKERTIAQDLLKRVENGDHQKISENYESAEKALKSLDHEKAAKLFNKASQIAEELYVIDIAEVLKEKSSFSIKIPDLSKKRNKLVQDARNLLDFTKEAEYRLKSKALEEFYIVDEKYKKK
ncbi:MAG: hypothetical protein ACTSP9_14540 [Promethearchaeota archaeon]